MPGEPTAHNPTPPRPTEKELFFAARELDDPAEREAWLREACGGDSALLTRVLDLLEAGEEDEDAFLEPDQQRLGEAVSAVGRELRDEQADPEVAGGAVDETHHGDRTVVGMLEAGFHEKPGDIIGRYKLLQKIGEGGGGVVYMADQTEPVKRRVALKVIKLGMDTRQVVARFEAERQALALMDHPNIAKVLDAGATESGRPYFVMELVRGVPITTFCDENKLSTAERLELFIQVCEAVQHAHQKGIIHRDLKPGNVLVTMMEDRPVPKVIDFGVAKAIRQELTEKTLFTQHGHFIGTPAYMSPEQASLTGYDIDTRSDIYALGVLLYELLTGRTPFDSTALLQAGYDEIRRVIAEDEPPKPSTRISTMDDGELTALAGQRQSGPHRLSRLVRGDLDWIVMKALEKDRRRRYETANGFAMDVRRHLANEPVTAGRPSLVHKAIKFARRNKTACTAGVIIAALLVASSLLSLWQASRTTEEKQKVLVEKGHVEAEKEKVQAEKDRNDQLFSRNDEEQGIRTLREGENGKAIARFARALRSDPDNQTARFRLLSAVTFGNRNSAVSPLPLFETPDNVTTDLITPDGLKLVTGSKDGTLRGWNLIDGSELFSPIRLDSTINSLAASPDSRRLAAVSQSGLLRLLDLHTGRELADPVQLEIPPIPPIRESYRTPLRETLATTYPPLVHFSADGNRLVSVVRFLTAARAETAEQEMMKEAKTKFPSRVRVGKGKPASGPVEEMPWTFAKRFFLPDESMVRIWSSAGEPVKPEPIAVEGLIESVTMDRSGAHLLTFVRNRYPTYGNRYQAYDLGIWNLAMGEQILPDGLLAGFTTLLVRFEGEMIGAWRTGSGGLAPSGWMLAKRNQVAVFDLDTGTAFEPAGDSDTPEGTHDLWDVANARRTPVELPEDMTEVVGGIPLDGRGTGGILLDERATIALKCDVQPGSTWGGKPAQYRISLANLATGAPFPVPDSSFRHVSLRPDGSWVVGRNPGSLHLWEPGQDPETGVRIEDVAGFAIAPDGERFVTASRDGEVTVFDRDGSPRTRMFPFGRGVTLIAPGQSTPTESSFQLRTVGGGQAEALRLGADGNTLLVTKSGFGTRTIRAWDIRERRALPDLTPLEVRPHDVGPFARGIGAKDRYSPVIISPDGRRAALVSQGLGHVWDLETGKLLGESLPPAPPPSNMRMIPPTAPHGQVTAATFNHDGTKLATGYHHGKLIVWDIGSGGSTILRKAGRSVRQAGSGKPGQGSGATPVNMLAFSADGTELTSVSHNGFGAEWVSSGFIGSRLDLKVLSAPGNGTIVTWDLASGTRTREVTAGFWNEEAQPWAPTPHGRPGPIAFARQGPEAPRIVMAAESIYSIDEKFGTTHPPLDWHLGSPGQCAAVSADGRIAAAGTKNGMLHVWGTSTGKPRFSPTAVGADVTAIALSRDGKMLATASTAKEVQLWDTRSGTVLTPPFLHAGDVQAISISADGSRLTTVESTKDRVKLRLNLTARTWRLPAAGERMDPWFLDFCEILGGQRISAEGVLEIVSPGEYVAARRDLAGLPSSASYRGLAHWLSRDDTARAIAPQSGRTLAEHVENVCTAGNLDELVHLLTNDHANPRLLAERAVRAGATPRGTWLFAKAMERGAHKIDAATLAAFANELIVPKQDESDPNRKLGETYLDLALERVAEEDAEAWLTLQNVKNNMGLDSDPSPKNLNKAYPRSRQGSRSDPLPHNVTLRWRGSFLGHFPIDFEQTGCGPEFVADLTGQAQAGNEDQSPPIVSASANIAAIEGGYRVHYSVGARIAITVGQSNVKYRDVDLRGTVLLSPGEPFEIEGITDSPLTLTVAPAGSGPVLKWSPGHKGLQSDPSLRPLTSGRRRSRQSSPSDLLPHNVTLRWSGSFQGHFPLDIAQTGCGPGFNANLIGQAQAGQEAPIVSARAHIAAIEGGYHVRYSVGARITIPIGGSVEYRDLVLRGSVLLSPGEPCKIAGITDFPLTLTVAPAGVGPVLVKKPAPPRQDPKHTELEDSAAAKPLPENISLHCKGSIRGVADVDVILRGCGPDFVADLHAPRDREQHDPGDIVTLHATVSQAADRYQVEYSIRARVPVYPKSLREWADERRGTKSPASATKDREPTNIEFRDRYASGTATLEPGEPFTVPDNKGGELVITLTPIPELSQP